MWILVTAFVAILLPTIASAQHQHQAAPYAGLQQRVVKALSEQQISDLRAGRGMALALVGELNGYPGPLHVLELADRLQLSGEQRQRVQQLFDEMKIEAIAVGEELIGHEIKLNQAFAERTISPTNLPSLTSKIGEIQGRLRAVHLRYHLKMTDLLTPHQRHVYAELRGYR